MHDLQIQALENTINQLNQPGEDEFMIRKEIIDPSKKMHQHATTSNNQPPPIELDAYQSRRQRRRQQKKFKYSKCFMNMTMAQMVKNREVDPLVALQVPAGTSPQVQQRANTQSPQHQSPSKQHKGVKVSNGHKLFHPTPIIKSYNAA